MLDSNFSQKYILFFNQFRKRFQIFYDKKNSQNPWKCQGQNTFLEAH